MQWWDTFKEWFLSLGENYGVNPYIFGGIYLGAIPLFFLFLGITIKNVKKKKPFVLSLLGTGFSFISAYLYLIIAGKNIPIWVYVFIGVMVLYSAFATYQKISKSTKSNAV